jgi:malate/lactate dehydrogenase
MAILWYQFQIEQRIWKTLMDFVKEGKISAERLDEIIDRTRKGGAEVVKF